MLAGSESLIIVREDQQDSDIRAMVTKSVDGEKRYSVRCEMDASDLENISKGGSVWITFFSDSIPDFMIYTAEV